MMLFSLILPAYKVERYIKNCLGSILNQEGIDRNEYEIIVVDDGSPDDSGKIAKEMLEDFPHARVIRQENSGQAAARNAGIEIARGEYIWFVDSDDWIEKNSLKILKEAVICNDHPDLVIFRAYRDHESGKREEYLEGYNLFGSGITTGRDLFVNNDWRVCPWFYLIKTSLLKKNDLRFTPGIYHEDSEFSPRLVLGAASVAVLDDFLYHYRFNDNSTTTTPNIKRISDYMTVCDSLMNFYDTTHLSGAEKKRMSEYIGRVLNNALNLAYLYFKDEKNLINDHIRKRPSLLKHLRQSGNKKYLVESLFFTLWPDYFAAFSFLSNFKK